MSVSLPQVWVKKGIYSCGQKQHRGVRWQENPLSYPGPILPEENTDNAPALHDKTCLLIVDESTLSDYQVIEFEDTNVTMIYENNKPFQYEKGSVISFSGTVMLTQNPSSKDQVNSISILTSKCKPCEKKIDASTPNVERKREIRDQEKIILDIISTLQNESGSSANLIEVINEAIKWVEFIDGREKVEDIIDKLCREGRMMRPSGYETLQIV
jgi:hypothetical protein